MAENTTEILVGDRVTFQPSRKDDKFLEPVWAHRVGREYTVTQVTEDTYQGAKYGYHCVEVTPTANRHNPIRPDWWYATDQNVRLVAKATYTPVEGS